MKKTKKLLSFFLAIMMVITTIPAFTLTASAATIDEAAYTSAINAYVSKMNDSYVYYNMRTAYNAYIALKQSYDLCKYGGSTTVTADTVNSNITKLNTAVNSMTQWTQYNSFFVPTNKAQMFAGDNASGISGTNYKSYYTNTLYVSGPVNDITSNTENYTTVLWNMPYAVGLYTGSQIEVPVMSGIYTDIPWNWSNKNGYMFTNFFDASSYSGKTTSNYNGQITYKDNWYYRSGTGSKHLSWATASPTGIAAGRVYNSPYSSFSSNGNGGSNNIRWAYNAVAINPTGFTSNYQEFTTLNLFSRTSNSQPSYSNWQAGALLYKNNASVGYYVIDYRPVTNNLTTAKTKIKSGIANFDSDNNDMSTLMGSVDKLTSVNNTIATTFPSSASGVSQATCQTNAKSVANTITSNVSEFTTNNGYAVADSARTTAYNNLRTAMDNAMANYLLGADELKKTYTANSVDAFITAYNNAKSIMSKVGALDENYGHDANDTNAKATALQKASLVEKADFTYYNTQFDAIPDALSVLTAKDGQNIRVYRLLEPYKSITLYTDAQKANTPKTSQTTVNNAGSAIADANTNINNSSVPGTDYVDQSGLQAFTAKYATCDTDVYKDPAVITTQTNSAKDLYETVTFEGTDYYSLNVADQSDLDNKITSYLNAINDVNNIVTYNVTVPSGVSVVVRGATQTPVSGNTYNLICGETVTFTNNNNDTAWYMAVQSNNTTRGNQYQAYGKAFTTKVVGNLTITAESAVAATPYYVAIIREYDKAGTGKAIDRVNYVANNSTYTLPTPTKIANYNFVEYVVNGETKAVGDPITITADTEITAKYQYVGSDLTVTVNGTAKTCAYNESVTVSAAGAYAWVEKTVADTWRPFYIGSAVTFRATESTELKSVTEEEFKATFTDEAYAPNLRLNGVLVDADNRAVFHAQRIDYLPTGAQIVEFGILLNKASSTDFDLGNDKGVGQRNEKTVRLKSTQSLDKVQFNIFVKNAGSQAFTYKSYMIYKLADGTVETVYSDVFTKA